MLTNGFVFILSICAIFQDEAPFLKEWIEYHRLLGVEHFYLFNDRSQDHYYEVLEPYIKQGIVELYDCPRLEGERHFLNQRRAYVRGLNKAKGETKWLAVIDLDEFIVPKQHDSIPIMLDKYNDQMGVAIQWQKFGTSGYWELPKDQLMIECLTRTSFLDHEDNFITKSIVQVDLLPEAFFNESFVIQNLSDIVHFCTWENYDGHKARKTGFLSHKGKGQIELDKSEAQINHYWCRNEKYYREEKIFRKARLLNEDFGVPYPWPEEKVERYLNIFNASEDHSIFRFIPALQQVMGEMSCSK